MLLLLTVPILSTSYLHAFEHHDSHVEFIEYRRDAVVDNKHNNKPYFLLFSAEWCHWCEVFNERTLKVEKVYTFLNKNFTNIFIDTDINGDAYKKYKAAGWPYVVFLNPDGSVYYRYSGTLYANDFLQVIEEIKANAKNGRSVFESDAVSIKYEPPTELDPKQLLTTGTDFRQAILENFDTKQFGVGRGEKAILPRTFLYLLKSPDRKTREQAYQYIAGTMQSAITHIYDPIEGGFYRYAEKRDWQIPHFEKMAGLNAGSVLLLYKLHKRLGDPTFKQAADKTLEYLTTTLFDDKTGSFLSFQEADTSYYFLNKSRRNKTNQPEVTDKVFIDRLANTLDYLIDVLEYSPAYDLQNKITRSLDLVAKMILEEDKIYHYYSRADKHWTKEAGLADLAFLSRVFLKAASKFQSDRYRKVAEMILDRAHRKYFVQNREIFFDEVMGDLDDIDSLIEINGVLVNSLMHPEQLGKITDADAVKELMTYFSKVNELVEDRTWDAREWNFAENYVPYITAIDQFLLTRNSNK